MLGVDFADIKRARRKIRAILGAASPRRVRPLHRRKSLGLSLHNIYETLVICWPTVIDAFAGRVTKDMCARAARVLGSTRSSKNSALRARASSGGENLGDPRRSVPGDEQPPVALRRARPLLDVLGANLRMLTKTRALLASRSSASALTQRRVHRDRPIVKPARARSESLADRQERRSPTALNVGLDRARREQARSKDRRAPPVQEGGLQSGARRPELRVLPITLSRDARHPAGARGAADRRTRASACATIHEPIDAAEYAKRGIKEGREALMKTVRAALESGLR